MFRVISALALQCTLKFRLEAGCASGGAVEADGY